MRDFLTVLSLCVGAVFAAPIVLAGSDATGPWAYVFASMAFLFLGVIPFIIILRR